MELDVTVPAVRPVGAVGGTTAASVVTEMDALAAEVLPEAS
jgi:hypothetical protein